MNEHKTSQYTEEVGFISFGIEQRDGTGPIIRSHYGDQQFTVFLKHSHPEWYTSSISLMDGRTVGEGNKAFLHQRLDEFIDWYLAKGYSPDGGTTA